MKAELRPEDLRIGNWVCENDIFENPAWHHTVIGIGIKESDDIWLSNCDIFKASELYPIPLSEDWPERLGFGVHKFPSPSRGKTLYFKVDNETFWIEIYFPRNEKIDVVISLNDKYLRHIKYVHHLQNLYYSLTGADLKELNKSF